MAKPEYAIDDRNKLHKDANLSLDRNLLFYLMRRLKSLFKVYRILQL